MDAWILYTLLAVLMQSARTAGQKQLAQSLSVPAVTLARFIFGLPFAGVYFLGLMHYSDTVAFVVDGHFLFWCTLAALSQIAATWCLVKALQHGNFAVGTALAKTEALLAALAGSWFFAQAIGWTGYLAVVLGVSGALLAANWQMKPAVDGQQVPLAYGLGAGLGFALASVWLKEGIASLAIPAAAAAASALVYMVALQALICLTWVWLTEPQQLTAMRRKWTSCAFVGLTSVAGSVGWFTAIGLQNPAIVKTLGQSEFLVTLAIAWFYFGERVSVKELTGMLLIVASVLLLVLRQ